MILDVAQSKLHGDIAVPPSKSHSIRALIFAAFADGESTIIEPLVSHDTDSACACIRALGVSVESTTINGAHAYRITPPAGGLHAALEKNSRVIDLDVGNSGSVLYFLAMLLSAVPAPFVLRGDTSIASRPLKPLVEIYTQGSVDFGVAHHNDPHVPLHLNGGLSASAFSSDGAFSQVISGLLMTAPFLDGTTTIRLSNPKEFSYVKMTVAWLESFGINVELRHRQTETLLSLNGQKNFKGFPSFTRTIPADWSGAIFPMLAALASSSALTLHNLDLDDSQGDKIVVEILQSMGVGFDINREEKRLVIHPPRRLQAIDIDCGNIPDTVPALCAIATLAHGTSRLYNAEMCRYKECDRLNVITTELNKMGAHIIEGENDLVIEGSGIESLHSATVDSHNDHRIALTLAALALGIPSSERTQILNAECCAVSYPDFIPTLSQCGAHFMQN